MGITTSLHILRQELSNLALQSFMGSTDFLRSLFLKRILKGTVLRNTVGEIWVPLGIL